MVFFFFFSRNTNKDMCLSLNSLKKLLQTEPIHVHSVWLIRHTAYVLQTGPYDSEKKNKERETEFVRKNFHFDFPFHISFHTNTIGLFFVSLVKLVVFVCT